MCLFHRWVRVEDADHSACGACFTRVVVGSCKDERYAFHGGACPHSFRVCSKCGKAEGYGSHGKLSVVPDTCKAQVASMQPK